jgi:DNA ligase (NAD+)
VTRDEYIQLARTIQAHDKRYYVDNDPSIADGEYDKLFAQLKAAESEHPDWIVDWSPSKRVGSDLTSSFPKIERKVPMLSLDNTYDEAELTAFHERVVKGLDGETPAYVIEPKIDGVSIELKYENGQFLLGATRGDGSIGEDVTPNLRTIHALPLLLAEPITVDVRGEVYMETKVFARLNAERVAAGEEPWKNPRNFTAGTIKLQDSRETAKRPLRLFTYEVVGQELDRPAGRNHFELLTWMKSLGLPVSPDVKRVTSLEELLAYVKAWPTGKKLELPYATDGLVIKVDALSQRRLLGTTARAPRWAIAYKFPAEQATSRILKVEANVGRTGAITPLASFDPVELSGTTVKNASLFNYDQIKRLELAVNDRVLIEKAGEIIPYIIAVVERPENRQPIVVPTECPSCATPLVREEGLVRLQCPNTFGCPVQRARSIEFFCKRDAMNMENLGEKLVAQLVQTGMVADVADLFDLTVEKLVELERMGQKSAENVVHAIAQAKTTATLTRLLVGLGIPGIGEVWAHAVAERFADLPSLMKASPQEMFDALMLLHGFGEERASAVRRFFEDDRHRAVLDKLMARGVAPSEPKIERSGPLAGVHLCVTGTLSRPRGDVQADIERAGGIFDKSVKKGTQYLVAGADVGETKLKDAQKKGVRVIDEEGLGKLLRGDALDPPT